MPRVDVVVIGAGQAGLALSRCLAEHHVDHVVLERGRIAERWHSERWESLRLLTPNWQTRLPHFRYDGDDPDGYMDSREVAAFLSRYADSFHAPVELQTCVTRVSASKRRLRHQTRIEEPGPPQSWRLRRDTATSPQSPHGPLGSSPPFTRSRPRITSIPPVLRPAGCWSLARPPRAFSSHMNSGRTDAVVIAVGRHMRIPGRIAGATSCGGSIG